MKDKYSQNMKTNLCQMPTQKNQPIRPFYIFTFGELNFQPVNVGIIKKFLTQF